jgi:hypothetical protein
LRHERKLTDFKGSKNEVFVIQLKDDGVVRLDTQRSEEGVFQLIANTSGVKDLYVTSIVRVGLNGAVELMQPQFKGGKMVLVSIDARNLEEIRESKEDIELSFGDC